MRKIPRTARNFFNPIISKLDKHVVPLPINYRASKNSLFKAKHIPTKTAVTIAVKGDISICNRTACCPIWK